MTNGKEVGSSSAPPNFHSNVSRGRRGKPFFKGRRAAPASSGNSSIVNNPSGNTSLDLTRELLENQLECSICTELIYSNSLKENRFDSKGKRIPSDPVWICLNGCQTFFHARCMTEWAKKCQSSTNSSQSRTSSNSFVTSSTRNYNTPKSNANNYLVSVNWTCPHCRLSYKGQIPTEKNALCYCGNSSQFQANENIFKYYNSLPPDDKKDNERMLKLRARLIPYSCQRRCRKKAPGGLCPHECNSICHPGPCPPCEKWIQGKGRCYCGKQQCAKYLCGTLPEPNYQGNDFSCGKICKSFLPCGQWMQQLLHSENIESILSSGQVSFFANGRQCSLKQARNWRHTCQFICHLPTSEAKPASIDSSTTVKVSFGTSEKVDDRKNIDTAEGIANNTSVNSKHGPCGFSIVGYCPCPNRTRVVIPCGQDSFMKYGTVQNLSDLFTCTNICNGVYLCGIHRCERICCQLSKYKPHEKVICPLELFTVDKPELCRCGNHRLPPLLIDQPNTQNIFTSGNSDKILNPLERKCLSIKPAICTDICRFIRPGCGHSCGKICCNDHSKLGLQLGFNSKLITTDTSNKNFENVEISLRMISSAPSMDITCAESKCQSIVLQSCNCGRSSRSINCHEASSDSFRSFNCGEVCNIRFFCGRHRCQQICCLLHSVKDDKRTNKMTPDHLNNSFPDNNLDSLLNEWLHRLGDNSAYLSFPPAYSLAGSSATAENSLNSPSLSFKNPASRFRRRTYKPLLAGLNGQSLHSPSIHINSFEGSNSNPLSALSVNEPEFPSFSGLSMVELLKPLLSAFPERACQIECAKLLTCGKHRCQFPCHPYGLSGSDILSLPLPSHMIISEDSIMDEILPEIDSSEIISHRMKGIDLESFASNSDSIIHTIKDIPISERTSRLKRQMPRKCRMTTLVIRGSCPTACLEGANYLNSYICPCGKTTVEPPLPCNFTPPICKNPCPRSYSNSNAEIGYQSNLSHTSIGLVSESARLQNNPVFCSRGHIQQYMEHQCHSRDLPCPYPPYCLTNLQRICKCKAATPVGPVMSCGFIPLQSEERSQINIDEHSSLGRSRAHSGQIISDIPCKTECNEILFPCSHVCGRICCSFHNRISVTSSKFIPEGYGLLNINLQTHQNQKHQPESIYSVSNGDVPKDFLTSNIQCLKRCSIKGLLSCGLHICQQLCHVSSKIPCSEIPCNQALRLFFVCPCGENKRIIPMTCSKFTTEYPSAYEELIQKAIRSIPNKVLGQEDEESSLLLAPTSTTSATSGQIPLGNDGLITCKTLSCDANCMKAQRLNALLSISKQSDSGVSRRPVEEGDDTSISSTAAPAVLKGHSNMIAPSLIPRLPNAPLLQGFPALPFSANTLQYVYERPNWTRSLLSIFYLFLEMRDSEFALHPLLLNRPGSSVSSELPFNDPIFRTSSTTSISKSRPFLSSHHVSIISTWTPYQILYQVGTPLSSFSKRPFIDFRKNVSGKALKRQIIQAIVSGINKGIKDTYEAFSGPSADGKDQKFNPNYPILIYEEIDREPFTSIRIRKEWKQEIISDEKMESPIDQVGKTNEDLKSSQNSGLFVKSNSVATDLSSDALIGPRLVPEMDLYYLLQNVSLSSLLQRFHSYECSSKEELKEGATSSKPLDESEDGELPSNVEGDPSSPGHDAVPMPLSPDSCTSEILSVDIEDDVEDENITWDSFQ